ncbi:MAG: hypothetical protein RBU21_08135 [FCB group bacterium]|jgi:hypothetical protein|nr:hypothetical protein [FCB group bacterium]
MDQGAKSCKAAHGQEAVRPDAEFEAFLVSIGWASTSRATDRGKALATVPRPVPELPEPPLPRTRAQATALRPYIRFALCLAFAALLVLGVVFRQFLQDALEDFLAQTPAVSPEQALANDLLARAHFASLLPGVSASEVRDRVGLPVSRGAALVLGGDQAWYYVTVPAGREGQPRRHVVTLSEGKVVRVIEITDLQSLARMPNSNLQSPRYLGSLKVQCDGRPLDLTPTARAAVLLVHSSIACPEGPMPASRVLRTDRITLAATKDPVESPPVALYWRGVLYPLATPTPRVPANELADDLRWLFRTLGCDETGADAGEPPAVPATPPPA